MNDYNLIFEAYKAKPAEAKKADATAPESTIEQHAALMSKQDGSTLVKEATEQKAPSPHTVDEINAQIQEIFQRHGIENPFGSEAFWMGVQDILRIDRADGRRLQELAKHWEDAFAKENIVKPHLAPKEDVQPLA